MTGIGTSASLLEALAKVGSLKNSGRPAFHHISIRASGDEVIE